MNVYDFDNTIFQGDSTVGLVLYCWGHRPKSLLGLPRAVGCAILFLLHIMPKKTFKQNLYHLFTYIPDIEKVVEQYSAERSPRIKKWYFDQQKPDDLVISASPQFLIDAFCQKAHISNVIASPVEIHTGIYHGENCHGQEKVIQFQKHYPNTEIQEFYSDSLSDAPLAKLAKKAYLVKGNCIIDWPKQ